MTQSTPTTQKTQKYEIKLGTKHSAYTSSRFWYFCVIFCSKIIYLGVAIWIAVMLYDKCLFNKDVNPIVVAYFGIISLACFLHVGLRADKLANVSVG